MKRGFTLIELLVSLTLLVLLVSFVAPGGSRLLDNVEKVLDQSKKERDMEEKKYDAFIKSKENRELNITSKGVML